MTRKTHARRRYVRSLCAQAAVAGAAAAGAAMALLATQDSSSASVWPPFRQGSDATQILPSSYQGGYTHTSLDCDIPSRIDPINVIFVGNWADYPYVDFHASDSSHGGWYYHQEFFEQDQYFSDHGDCEPLDGANANRPPQSPTGRYHMRYNQGPAPDPTWGFYTVAAAHHEDFSGLWPWDWCHAVDSEEDEPVNGFDMARTEIYWNWTVEADDDHFLSYQEDWGNTQPFEQCDGQLAASHGMVYFIEMPNPDVGGGGSSGGGRGGGFGMGW